MLFFERLFRRLAYSFGVSGLLTLGFQEPNTTFYIPIITLVVAFILFVFSWRIQKEYKEIILKIDGPDAADPTQNWFGNLYERSPHQYHTLWQGFYSFGAVLIATIAIKNFGYNVYTKEGYTAGLICIVLFIVVRFFDPKSKRRYYEN